MLLLINNDDEDYSILLQLSVIFIKKSSSILQFGQGHYQNQEMK